MPTLVKYATHICQIDRASSTQASSSSCDVGLWNSTTNNCFFNFESLNTQIPPGSTITSASLILSQASGGYAAILTSKVTLRKGDWGAFTWNQGPLLACAGIQFTLQGIQPTRAIDVTNIVQWIVDNNSPDHIFRLERVPNDQTGTTDAKRFSTTTSSHSLEITYTTPAPNKPPVPILVAPVAGSTTFSTTPRILLKTGAYADGAQIVRVSVNSGAWYDSAVDTARFSVSGSLGSNAAIIFIPPPLSPGSHTLAVKAVNAATGTESDTMQAQFTIAASPFTAIEANTTTAQAAHIQQLRDAVNIMRRYYGLPIQAWKEAVVGGKTPIWCWPLHIAETRSAMDEIVNLINAHDAIGTFDVPPVGWLPFAIGRPRADAMRQIQDLILTL